MSTGAGYPGLGGGGEGGNTEAPPDYEAPPTWDEANTGPSAPAYNPEATPLNQQQPVQVVTQQPPAAYGTMHQQPQQVIVQQPTQQMGTIQPAAPAAQVVVQQPQTVQQPNIVYVNQFGQPIAAPTQQKVVVVQQQPPQQRVVVNNGYPGSKPQQVGTQVVVAQQPAVVGQQQRQRVEDPTCIWIFGCFGFFFWPIGCIGMCVYQCGSGLSPRMKSAYNCMVICTLIGFVLNMIMVFAN